MCWMGAFRHSLPIQIGNLFRQRNGRQKGQFKVMKSPNVPSWLTYSFCDRCVAYILSSAVVSVATRPHGNSSKPAEKSWICLTPPPDLSRIDILQRDVCLLWYRNWRTCKLIEPRNPFAEDYDTPSPKWPFHAAGPIIWTNLKDITIIDYSLPFDWSMFGTLWYGYYSEFRSAEQAS